MKSSQISIALYQPDIPQNVGSVLRLGACMSTPIHLIGPCGFPLDDRRLRRVAMDYYAQAQLDRHASWEAFRVTIKARIVLFSTHAETDYSEFSYRPGDALLFGRESAGVPEAVHQAADARVKIPISPDTRSLNVAMAAALGLGEALRQLRALP